MYTEPAVLKYGKLATKYPWIYENFLQCNKTTTKFALPLVFLTLTTLTDATVQ